MSLAMWKSKTCGVKAQPRGARYPAHGGGANSNVPCAKLIQPTTTTLSTTSSEKYSRDPYCADHDIYSYTHLSSIVQSMKQEFACLPLLYYINILMLPKFLEHPWAIQRFVTSCICKHKRHDVYRVSVL